MGHVVDLALGGGRCCEYHPAESPRARKLLTDVFSPFFFPSSSQSSTRTPPPLHAEPMLPTSLPQPILREPMSC